MQTNETTPAVAPEASATQPQRIVLLGKEHDITAFASNDPSRLVLNGVHYNEKAQCLEATNGRMLIRVPVTVDQGDDFPPLSGERLPAKDCIIPLAPFKKALSSIPNGGTLPILRHVVLSGSAGDKLRLTTNDLDTEQNAVTKRIDGTYPDTEQVIPTAPAKFAISLDPSLLQTVAAYFAKHCGEKTNSVRLEFTDELSPVRFTGTLASGKKAFVILMPMRMS